MGTTSTASYPKSRALLLLRALSRLREMRSSLLRAGILATLASVAEKGHVDNMVAAADLLVHFVGADAEGEA